MKASSIHANLLLGAAFAGLSALPAQAATVLNETTDFSNNPASPTDLTTTFTNFLNDSGVTGTIATGTQGSDPLDYFTVQMTPSASASIPFTIGGTSVPPVSILMYLDAYSDVGVPLDGSGSVSFPSGGSLAGTLDFTVPANGLVVFRVSTETSNAAMNYSIGAVPETGTAVLGLAGLAAAALRRSRQAR